MATLFVEGGCKLSRDKMNPQQSAVLRVRVLSAILIEKFSGEALWAGVRPRYVVALLLLDTKSAYKPQESDFELTTHRMAFFAIDSIVKVFVESDIVGKEFTLNIQSQILDQTTRFFVSAE